MRIGLGQHAQAFRGQIRAPGLAEGNEETLLGSESSLFPIELFVALALGSESFLHCHERNAQATVVGGIFAQSQVAIDIDAGRRFKAGVFVSNAFRAAIELLAVSLGPPVA